MPTYVKHFYTSNARASQITIAVVASLVLALSACLIHPLAPIAIMFGFWILVLSIRSPFILTLFFVVFWLGRLADFFPILGAMQAGKMLALLALTIFIFSKIVQRDFTIVHSKLLVLVVLFTAAMLISAVAGTYPSGSWQLFTEDFLKVLIIFFLILNTVKTPRQVVTLQIVLALTCTFIGSYASLAKILGKDPMTGAELVEGSRAGIIGALGDPNDTAFLILSATPFLIIAAIEANQLLKIPFIFMTVCTFTGIVATQSRGGLLGLTAACAVILERYIKNKMILVIIGGCLLGSLVVIAGISDRESGGSKEEGIDASAQGRLDAWYAGARMLAANPITGVGAGQFADNFLNYAVNPVSNHPMVTHNSYIQVASELGLPGFILYFSIVAWVIKASTKARRIVLTRPKSLIEIVNLGLLPCLVATLISAFFLSVAYSNLLFIEFAFIAACSKIGEGLDNQSRNSNTYL